MIPVPKLWPWKWIGLGIGTLALLAGIFFGVKAALDGAYGRGEKAGQDAVQARWNAETAGRAQARAELSAALAEAFGGLDTTLQQTVSAIGTRGQEINLRLTKEMADDPRYQSADCSLTPGVLDQVNAARGLSGPAAPARVGDGGVPSSGAAVRLDLGAPR